MLAQCEQIIRAIMLPIPKKVAARLVAGLKRFQPIVAAVKARDANESDTVTIITDLLSEVFGYDKYSEVTSEQAIRGTYCDLALRVNGKLQLLIEAKAIGVDLREGHSKQAIDYAANQGVEWVLLTNAERWLLYKVTFGKPIGQELVLEFNFLQLQGRQPEALGHLFLLTKEGWEKAAIDRHVSRVEALNRYTL